MGGQLHIRDDKDIYFHSIAAADVYVTYTLPLSGSGMNRCS
jgi:hypothetical protein